MRSRRRTRFITSAPTPRESLCQSLHPTDIRSRSRNTGPDDMLAPPSWHKEPGSRVASSRPLDDAKVQAPCIVRRPEGGFRLFYTAVGSAKPFRDCQGYILSAVSDDGLAFVAEPG